MNPFKTAAEAADREAREAAKLASEARVRNPVIIMTEDGNYDVTEYVVTLLDAIASSMDWGSGFLNREDLVAWKTLADLLAFDQDAIDDAVKQIRTLR